MRYDLQRWAGLAAVLAASGALVYLSGAKLPATESAPPVSIELPAPPADYEPPKELRDIFGYKDLPPPDAEESVPGADGKPAQRAPKPSELVINLDGIVWYPANPLASINGKLLSEGGHFRDIRVIKIYPDRVVLKIKNKIVEKSLKR